MKNTISLQALWLLLIVVSCSNEQANKSEITQYPMPLMEEVEEQVLLAKPMNVSLKNEPLLPPDVSLIVDCEAYPEPPILEQEPDPGPDPVIYIPKETMEDKWQEIIRLQKYQIEWQHFEFCLNYGDTLIKQKGYEAALKLYEKAKNLRGRPTGEIYVEIARIYALQGRSKSDIAYCLEDLHYLDFKNYDDLLYDAAFEDFRKWNEFPYHYKNIFGSNKKAMFDAFIALAPKKDLKENFDLSPVNLFENIEARGAVYSLYREEHPIIYNYFDAFAEEANYNIFSRSGDDNCRYEMCLLGTEKYFAVIYSVEESWSEYILPKKYYLLTYDLNGNKISKLEIANRGSLKTCKGFVLQPDNTLSVTDYKIKWKAGAKKTWKNKNFMNYKQLKKTIVQSSQTYKITETGRLIEMGKLLTTNKKL